MADESRELEFVAFYNQFLPQVYRYVRYRVVDAATAGDLTATVFEKALRGWNRRRKPKSVGPWVFRIACNTVASHYRRQGRWLEAPLEGAENEPSAEALPEERVLYTERWACIYKGIQTLSRREQEIIALKFGSGLTNRAIAPIVGVSESNVAVILHRAMRKLHVRLEEQAPSALPERSASRG